MENIERENRKTGKFKKYTAVSIIILGLFFFYLCTTSLITELTSGYQTLLYDWLGKTNKWSGTYGPESLVDVAREFTAFAGQLFIPLFSAIFGGYLFIRKKYRTLYTYFFVVLGAGIFLVFLKNYYGGEVWYDWFNLFKNDGKVFPSGHAFMSIVFYFTIARLIYRANPEKKLDRYVFTVAFILSFLIGISLIIIGAHSPNQVIAGWSMGFAWISAAWLVDHKVRKKIHNRHQHKEPELSGV